MTCPTCDETLFSYLFVVRGLPVARCRGCGLVALGILPRTADFSDFYDDAAPAPEPSVLAPNAQTELDASSRYLKALASRGVTGGRVLLIGAPERRFSSECFVHQTKTGAFQMDFHESTEELAGTGEYDAAVLLHHLQTRESPGAALDRVHAALKPCAPLLVTVPDVESWPRKFFGQQWTEWRPENRLYFDRRTMQLLLLRHGFRDILIRSDRRLYNLHHIYRRASSYPRTTLTRLISAVHKLVPEPVCGGARMRLATSGMVVTALRSEPSPRPKCSIVVPAFNESKSFPVLMDALLEKQIPGVEREIIIVESNSTDGTREIAKRYEQHPEVRVIYEDRPRGKGHAVREGFRKATGDVLLIQDADLEYDLNDYDSLLAPILSNRSLFVLGTRHGGNFKMRQFAGQEGLSTALNFGHIFFTGVINLLYRQKMKDPFTMFKVFHRDCLYGLDFECRRFDFDHELVIKLVRKGYTPLEIPVNYHSRSFRQGKKVRMFRDPFGWLWIDVKLRFQRLYRGDRD